MGYRSSIYIKVDKKHKRSLIDTIEKAELNKSFESESNYGDDYYRTVAHGLKWYDSYPDVKLINTFIEDDDVEPGEKGLLAIGEDGAEVHYGNTDDVGLYTTTDVDW